MSKLSFVGNYFFK